MSANTKWKEIDFKYMREYRVKQIDNYIHQVVQGNENLTEEGINYLISVLKKEMSETWIDNNSEIIKYPKKSVDWLRHLQVAIYNENFTKCKLFTSYIPPNTMKIRVDPSGACNFTCKFCPCNNVDYMNDIRHAIMPLDIFEMLINDLKEFPKTIDLALELYGYGEPLLNDELPLMISYAKQQLNIPVIFTTNGSLLNPELNDLLIESKVDFIRISLNGLSSTQYKEVTGTEVDFDKLVSNIEDLHEKANGNPYILIKAVNALFYNKSDYKLFEYIFSNISDKLMVENVEGIWQDYSFTSFEASATSQINGVSYINTQFEPERCTYPFTEMTVFSNGDVGLCCSDWKHNTKYGSILSDSLYDLQQSVALEKIRQQHLTMPRSQISFCSWCKRATGTLKT